MRSPRFFRPSSMYEVVVRTVRGRCLLRPSPELTAGVYVILARALALYRIALHAFTYLSNHAHLLLSDAAGDQVAPFMGYVNRNTAKLAKELTGWEGTVFDRYRPIPVLDDDASIRRLEYVLANGVKEGLVESPLDWPGPSSARALVEGTPITVEAPARKRNRKGEQDQTIETLSIDLAPLPAWASLATDDRRARARELVALVEEMGRRHRQGRPVVGVERILAQDPWMPIALDDDARPAKAAHASERDAVVRYRVERELFLEDYNRARQERRRRRDADRGFPAGGYPTPPGFNHAA